MCVWRCPKSPLPNGTVFCVLAVLAAASACLCFLEHVVVTLLQVNLTYM